MQAASETVLELPEKQLSTQTFNYLFSKLKKEIPSVIDTTEALLKGHIKRLTELETDENTIAFENADGSRTEYLFSFPVKYTDKNDKSGSLKDASLKIKKDISSFTTEANSIITTFSKYLSKGISLKSDNVNISMFPKTTKEKKGTLSADGLNVTYNLDSSTKLDYSLTYLGFKENIIVSEYTGCTEYRFTIETNGLKPEKLDGS